MYTSQELTEQFAVLFDDDPEYAHVWLQGRFHELCEAATSRDDERCVAAAEVLADLVGCTEYEEACTVATNGIVVAKPKTLQSRAAAVCRRLRGLAPELLMRTE